MRILGISFMLNILYIAPCVPYAAQSIIILAHNTNSVVFKIVCIVAEKTLV